MIEIKKVLQILLILANFSANYNLSTFTLSWISVNLVDHLIHYDSWNEFK